MSSSAELQHLRFKIAIALGVCSLGCWGLPGRAYSIYTGVDQNGNPGVNLLSTTGIPQASAAANAFLANLKGVGTETFESFSSGTLLPLNIAFPGAGTATITGGNAAIASAPVGQTNGVGRYGVSPTQFLEIAAGSTGDFKINFGSPVAAFGFYGIDIGDFNGTLNLLFSNGAVGTQSIPTAPLAQADGSVLFWGIITSPADGDLSGVVFQTTVGSGDYFAYDNMTIGSRQQVVPPQPGVPAPLSLFGAGAALGWSRRLRRRCQA